MRIPTTLRAQATLIASDNNILCLLHRWARRQDENFISEAFAHLLRESLQFCPAFGIAIIESLTDRRLALTPELAAATEVRTQVSEESGRPDIELRAPDRVGYIEVKVESGLGDRQISRYRHELAKQTASRTSLTLLTKYAVAESETNEQADAYWRWAGVADLLEDSCRKHSLPPCLTATLDQFLGFLHFRGLAMEKVSWELESGVRALRNLLAMVDSACGQREKKRGAGQDYDGFYLKIGDKQAWVGIAFAKPATLRFSSDKVPVPRDTPERLGYGVIENASWLGHGYQWVHTLPLDSEEVHFFSRSKERQLACVEEFIDLCLNSVAKVVAPAASPTN